MVDRLAILKSVPFLDGLSKGEIEALAERAVVRPLATDEILFEQGEPAQGMHVVASGSVKVTKLSESGREQILTIERSGQSIAEVPLFDGGPYPASAVALEPSEILFVPRAEFLALLRRHPEIAIHLLAYIGRRLRQLVFLVEELSLKEVGQRLALFLLQQAARSEGDQPELELMMSNQEIAARIGTVRELVSRGLGRLKNTGLIAVEGRVIRILDVEALEHEAERGK